MPIHGLSDQRRLPRLGKIRLGIKVRGARGEYPKAVDYFVCPEEVRRVYGQEPRELDILFPVEDDGIFAQQFYRCYGLTYGLLCQGDGITARRKVDLTTGGIADRNTKEWDWRDSLPCDPGTCPEYAKKQCRRVMNLQFMLPKVPGLGVYQIDTTSWHSIVNMNSASSLIRGVCGRIAMIPLRLFLDKIEVDPPGAKKKHVWVLQISQNVSLEQLLDASTRPVPLLVMPPPAVEEPPDDLFPEAVEETPDSPPEEAQPIEEKQQPQVSSAPKSNSAQFADQQDLETKRNASWYIIRALQSKDNIDDKMITGAIRQESPELKGKRFGKLGDIPPEGVRLEALEAVRTRLEIWDAHLPELRQQREQLIKQKEELAQQEQKLAAADPWANVLSGKNPDGTDKDIVEGEVVENGGPEPPVEDPTEDLDI